MDDKRKNAIITIFFSILFLGTSCYFWFTKEDKVEANEVIVKSKNETSKIKEKTIFVDIKGEIKVPGLYEIPSGKRVMDVIEAAGGLTELADTRTINLSKIVEDQMVIIVDNIIKEENSESITNDAKIDVKTNITTNKNISNSSKLVSINKGSKEELMTLNGIGNSKADAIIKYRNSHGDFKTKEELLEVDGIGEGIFTKIKDHITL